MELADQNAKRYKAAQKKAQNIRSFYVNLLAYCLVIPVLAWINLTFTPEIWWFLFSATGWGIGLAFHAAGAFDINPLFGEKWKERKIRELMEKENSKK